MSTQSIGEDTLVRQGNSRLDQVLHAKELLEKRLKDIPPNVAGSSIALENYINGTNFCYLSGSYRPGVNSVSYYNTQTQNVTLSSGGNTSTRFNLPNEGHLVSDITFEFRFDGVTQTNSSHLLRYCALPGIRIIDKAELVWGGEDITSYTVDDVNMIDKFEISADEREAWNEAMGQQNIRHATAYNSNGFNSHLTYTDGPQTRKNIHGSWSMMVPAQFSFGKDTREALLRTDKTSNAQNEIKLTLGKLDDILYQFSIGGDQENLEPANSTLGVTITMHTNIIVVDNSLYRSLLATSEIQKITTRKSVKISIDQDENSVSIPLSMNAASHMAIGVRATANANDPDQWHLFGVAKSRTPGGLNELLVPVYTGPSTGSTASGEVGKEVSVLEPLISELGFLTDYEEVFPKKRRAFYSDAQPLSNSVHTRVFSTKDNQAMLLKFNAHAGQHQLSNYLALPSSSDPRISYTSDSTNKVSENTSEMVISITGFNFIYTDEDKFRLVYPGS